MYVDVARGELDWRDVYRLAIGFINPRPIALASTVAADGRTNLAPYSFFNMVSANPPLVIICPGLNRHRQHKDTFLNIQATGEFVVATVTADIVEPMNTCSAELPRGDSEFDFSGLTPTPATIVRPPLVAEAKVNIECKLWKIVATGDGPGSAQVTFGEIVAIHIDDDVLTDDGRSIDPHKLTTVGRLGGLYYANVTAPYALPRPGAGESGTRPAR